MGSEAQPLHILFFPFMAPGHMNPMIDIAKLFTRRGVKVTILTTPANVPLIQPTIDRANQSNHNFHHPISIELVPFPYAEVGLHEGCENLFSLPSQGLQSNFLRAVAMLRQPFHRVLTELAPDCVVTDRFFPWTSAVASEHGVPRLEFTGTSFFVQCVTDSLVRNKPLESLPPAAESVVIPGLPHRIEMLRSQIPDITKFHPAFLEMFAQANEAESETYGVIVNSFYELEPDYVQHYSKVIGRKAWHVGPVSLLNNNNNNNNNNEVEISTKGSNKASIVPNACLKWLDSKTPGSVVYVCFGSLSDFNADQLREIALGLEACNYPFILVVRDCNQDWMPEGYEKRIEGKGLLIREWAPQVLILNHPAVGGFVTHCGWNSCLEGMSAGLPFVTWPLFADQFYNERFILDVLGIGVSMGAKEYVMPPEERVEVVDAAQIKKAVDELMDSGEEAERKRRRARELPEKARRAVEEGGSSYIDLGYLIQELMYKRDNRLNVKM